MQAKRGTRASTVVCKKGVLLSSKDFRVPLMAVLTARNNFLRLQRRLCFIFGRVMIVRIDLLEVRMMKKRCFTRQRQAAKRETRIGRSSSMFALHTYICCVCVWYRSAALVMSLTRSKRVNLHNSIFFSTLKNFLLLFSVHPSRRSTTSIFSHLVSH